MSYDLQLSNGDFVVDLQGDVIVIEGYIKLQQDVDRLAKTSRGENKFDSEEGMGIYDMLGRSLPKDLQEMLLNKDVVLGLQHMIDQQTQQSLIQALSPYEQIASIDGLVIQQLGLKGINFLIAITTQWGLRKTFVVNVSK